MGIQGVPYKLFAFPFVSLVLIIYVFYGSAGPNDEWRDHGDNAKDNELQSMKQQLSESNSKLALLKQKLRALSDKEKAKPKAFDPHAHTREREQDPHKHAERVRQHNEEKGELTERHQQEEERQTHEDLATRHCYFVSGNGVGDYPTMGMYRHTGEHLHGKPVYKRAGGAWTQDEKWMARGEDGRWLIVQTHGDLDSGRGVWVSKDSLEEPDSPGVWMTLANGEWIDISEFHVVERSKQDCSEIPDLDDAVPVGGEIHPVNGTHFVADYDVTSPRSEPNRYSYPRGKRAFTYIQDREERAGPFPPYKVVSEIPKIYYFERLLTDEECDSIIEAAKDKITRSGVVPHKGSNASSIQDVRTSSHAWLTESVPAVNKVMNRLMAVTGFGITDHEALQVLRYKIDQKYDAHHDYFDPQLYGNQKTNRALTCFLYLDDVPEGGHTWFPRANGRPNPPSYTSCRHGIKVTPIKGAVACFYDMRPDYSLDEYSLHGGCPVKQGVKWGGTLWFHTLV